MDEWAEAFWSLFLLMICGLLFFTGMVAFFVGKSVKKRFIKKTNKYTALKVNLLLIFTFYSLSSVFMFFFYGPGWGKDFALIFLPIISIMLLIFLETIEILKEVRKRIFKKDT